MSFDDSKKNAVDESILKQYNVDSTILFGGTMKLSASDVIRKCLCSRGHSLASFGRMLNCTGQNISLKLKRRSVTADEFVAWMDMLGYEVSVRDKETGIDVEDSSETRTIRHIRKMIDGISFSNYKAHAISNTFGCGVDGIYDKDGKASELYQDDSGNMILVEYDKDDPSKDLVVHVPASAADAFAEKYGVLSSKI